VGGRGVGRTPGKLNPFSRQEALDYYDAIQWAAEQPWSDGNVGLLGGSYNATIQWNVAALHPPTLKAIAPLASDSDAYRDLAYPGGLLLGNYRRW
jgi:putative CocE/NonD family hydrolase